MSKKIDFQIRVLKKYGVIPVFDGEPDYTNVKTSLPGETFKQWCARVIGKKNDEVSLYCLYKPKGIERIGNLGREGENLKKIVQAQSRKSFVKGLNKSRSDGEHEVPDDWIPAQTRSVTRDDLYETLADAVPDRTEAIDQFFKRFSDQQVATDSWIDLFENLAIEYATLAGFIRGNGYSSAT